MGNRANVIFVEGNGKNAEISCAVYLHWNGGVESVYAFIKELERRKWTRLDYAPARFCQVVGEFFRGVGERITGEFKDEGLSLGVFKGPNSLDKDDLAPFIEENGLFIVTQSDHGRFEVKQHLYNKTNKVNDVTIKKLLKDAGKSYSKGYEDKPQKTFEHIQQFFLRHEAALAAAKENKEAA